MLFVSSARIKRLNVGKHTIYAACPFLVDWKGIADMLLSSVWKKTLRVSLAVSMAVVFACVAPMQAYADPTSADVQTQVDAALAQLSDYQSQLQTATDNYEIAASAHEEALASMNDAQERADTAEAQASTLQGHLSTRAVAMYKNGSSSLIDVLFGSSTFTEFTSNWDFLQSMNTSDAESITELQAAKEEAASAREEYAVQEQEAQAKLDEAEQIKNDAEALVADKQSVYDSLSAEAAALVQQEAAADATTYGGATAGSYDSVGGSNAVERAYSYVGNASYVWGACSPGAFDCSGFVSYCLTGSTVG